MVHDVWVERRQAGPAAESFVASVSEHQRPVRAGKARGHPKGLRIRYGSMWGEFVVVRLACIHSSYLQLRVKRCASRTSNPLETVAQRILVLCMAELTPQRY